MLSNDISARRLCMYEILDFCYVLIKTIERILLSELLMLVVLATAPAIVLVCEWLPRI
jgi:hypothetical protein